MSARTAAKPRSGSAGRAPKTAPKQRREAAARAVIAEGLVMAKALCATATFDEQLALSRGLTDVAVAAYWDRLQSGRKTRWKLADRPTQIETTQPTEAGLALGKSLGEAAADLEPLAASYALGTLYTSTMPQTVRSGFGAFYTPPPLCGRLLDLASKAGVDWTTARVLDPACGGGAFLSPVARRMAASLKGCSAKIALRNIANRLKGFELDSYAAWLSHVFLEVELSDLCRRAGERLPNVIEVGDSLERHAEAGGFDLVVGNPPYGRTKLSPALRSAYKRSLFGHANLYGVFTDLALRLAAPGGIVAYVTPTSFLAGEYFKALREVLAKDAPPVAFDFIEARKGVFAGVLQETMLAVYKRDAARRPAAVHVLDVRAEADAKVTAVGKFKTSSAGAEPWVIGRSAAQSALAEAVAAETTRLSDYGYKVSTGPLVWNRHKPSLKDQPAKGRFPLVWAESVRTDGRFEFRSDKKNHRPFFEPKPSEQWVVTDFPCVLVQRTTAKEQHRRLIAAELPESFLTAHKAVVIENHLNMVRPLNGKPKVSPAALAALLNSKTIDEIFRCISGSVAVSAFELSALPLPPAEAVADLERLVRRNAKPATLERTIRTAYGLGRS